MHHANKRCTQIKFIVVYNTDWDNFLQKLFNTTYICRLKVYISGLYKLEKSPWKLQTTNSVVDNFCRRRTTFYPFTVYLKRYIVPSVDFLFNPNCTEILNLCL